MTESAKFETILPVEASIPQRFASLEAILCTEELHRRPWRPPDYQKENRALVALAKAMTGPPSDLLQTFAETILDVTECDSSGLSLLTKDDGGKRFYWPAIAGAWKPHTGRGTPRGFGPCGDVLDRNCPLLFRHFERRYQYLLPIIPAAEECLLVPFYVGGTAVGTIWAIMHGDRRRFDGEDERIMSTLGQFASLAYQTLESNDDRKSQIATREQVEATRSELNEEALRQSEFRTRLILDSALDAVLSIDEQGRITEWNAQAETMFGWLREEAIGRCLSETLIPMQYRAAHEEGLRHFLRTGEGAILNRRVEITALHRNGREFPVELSVVPYRFGETWWFSGFIRDITERKRLYSDLQEREAKVRRLVDSNIIGIFIWGLHGQIIDANEAFLRLVGYSRDDLRSGRLRWWELTPAEWRDADDRRVQQLKAIGISQPYEKEYFHKSGKRVPVLVGAATFEGSNDEGVGFVVDLTDRKKAEGAASESERRYREIEMELAHANRVAAMGQLSASIAHEVNQPIAATVTYANAALRWLHADPPELGEVGQALGRIVANGKRASDVIGRIHAFIKKTPARKDAVEINQAIVEVIALTRSEVSKNGVIVATHLGQGLPLIQGDRVQLQQVVLNLIFNAVDAMSGLSEGPRELLISSDNSGSGGLFVSVQDSGPGLAPASLERAFEAFYTTKSSGLGMGLSICRSIIEAHGGRLWASANVPRGAIFTFSLPPHPGG